MGIRERIAAHREEIVHLAAKPDAREVRVFGSAARREADEESDLDLLVAMEPGRSLFDMGALLIELEELLGCPVDIVTEAGMHNAMRERVLREAGAQESERPGIPVDPSDPGLPNRLPQPHVRCNHCEWEAPIMTLPPSIEIDRLPDTLDDFVALRDAIAGTPQGGAAVMVVALLLYARDEALGRRCLTIAVDRGRLIEGPDGVQGWQLGRQDLDLIRRQVGERPTIAASYVQGTTPQAGYALPEPPYRIAFGTNPYSGDPESGEFKAFVVSSGAASSRPVVVRRNARGIWKAYEWSSLLLGVVAPARQDVDDL